VHTSSYGFFVAVGARVDVGAIVRDGVRVNVGETVCEEVFVTVSVLELVSVTLGIKV